jgi:hypothetical protein
MQKRSTKWYRKNEAARIQANQEHGKMVID